LLAAAGQDPDGEGEDGAGAGAEGEEGEEGLGVATGMVPLEETAGVVARLMREPPLNAKPGLNRNPIPALLLENETSKTMGEFVFSVGVCAPLQRLPEAID
jgi:hypothetical protein